VIVMKKKNIVEELQYLIKKGVFNEYTDSNYKGG